MHIEETIDMLLENGESIERVSAVLECPKRDQSSFSLAIRGINIDDVPRLLTALDGGIVKGDWRRRAVGGRIRELVHFMCLGCQSFKVRVCHGVSSSVDAPDKCSLCHS